MTELFKNKKAIIVVAAVLVLIVAAGVALAMNLGQGEIDIAEQLSLGEKYLLEMDYEKAILAFNKVIKVDPRNVKAYLGLADAYVGIGDTDKAIKTLEKGLKLTGDESIKAKLEALKRAEGSGNEWVDWSVDDWVLGGIGVINASPEDMAKVLGAELRYEDEYSGLGPATILAVDISEDGYSQAGEYLNNLKQFYQIETSNPGVSGIGGLTIGKTSIDEVLAMFPLPDEGVTYITPAGHGSASVRNETGVYSWLYPLRDQNNPEGYPDQLLFYAMVNSHDYNYSINFDDGGKVDRIWFEDISSL